jgi:hypothetical protein
MAPDKDNTHGEEEKKPRFGPQGPDGGGGGVYDPEPGDATPPPLPDPPSDEESSGSGDDESPDSSAGDAGTGGRRGRGSSSSSSGQPSRQDIDSQESTGATGASTAVGAGEQSILDGVESAEARGKAKRGLFRKEGPGRFSFGGLRGKVTKKRIVTLAIIGLLSGGGIYGVAVLSGPFQFIHFSQRLQKHFKSNEDFGNDRSSKVLLYALLDKGSQNGRLGITGNASANKWEKKLEKQAGMRPVYSSLTRRFVGFELVDENKAHNFLADAGDTKNRKVQESMGKGAEIRSGAGRAVVSPDGSPLAGDRKFLDLSKVNFGDRRAWIKTVGKATTTNRVASALGSRLLIKRAGVPFHPLNKAKGKVDNTIAKQIEKKRAKTIENGVEQGPNGTQAKETKDKNGNTTTNQSDVSASDETKSYIDDFKNSGSFKTAKSGAIITGVLCVAKKFGTKVEAVRFTNNVLPMIRLGVEAVAVGDQARSGDDIDLGTMGVMTKHLYDPESNTSVSQAASVRAEDQKQGGVPPQKEADLGKIGEKPEFFKVIDSIPGLGTVCDIQDTIGGLPIISDIGNLANSVVEETAGLFGVDINEIMASALKAVAGKAVDPASRGANYGNLANTGAFLAGGDQAIATGAAALTNEERTQLTMLEKGYEAQDQASKSLASRYLDPYDSTSVVSSVIDSSPSNPDQAASMISNPIHIIGSGFANLFSHATPKASAAGLYDYGIPKYAFSVREQSDPKFENPYDNAKIVEPQLDALNAKYGKCFGMTITADDSGVHVNNADKSVNVYEVAKNDEYKDCRDDKNQEVFMRYRFYIADSVTAVSLACFEGDDTACSEIGTGQTQGSGNDTSGTASNGDLQANKDKFTDILKLPGGAKGPPELGFYNQSTDKRWASKPYPYAAGGSNTISASGCGPSSLAMVISTLGNKILNPYQVGQLVQKYHVSGGTDMNGAIKIVETYGLKQHKLGSNLQKEVRDTVEGGGLVIMSANPASPFTQAGHFVVIRAVSDDGSKFYVGDPADDNSNGQDRSLKAWPMSSLPGWTSTGLWAVEKK